LDAIVIACGMWRWYPKTQVDNRPDNQPSATELNTGEAQMANESSNSEVNNPTQQETIVTDGTVDPQAILTGPSIVVSPLSPDATSVITATHELSEIENTFYRWYVNDVLVSTTESPIFDKNVVRADNIYVELELLGDDQSYKSTSDVVSVRNSSPTIESIVLGPENATTADTLEIAVVNMSDLDGDTIEIEYRWFVNGEQLPNENRDTLDGSLVTLPEKELSCLGFCRRLRTVWAEAQITDGIDMTVVKSEVFTVLEDTAVFENNYSATNILYGETLDFNAGFVDSDGASVPTYLLSGPVGLVYVGGRITWKAEPIMLSAVETYTATFISEHEQIETIEITVENPQHIPLMEVLTVDGHPDVDLSGWAQLTTLGDPNLVFVSNSFNDDLNISYYENRLDIGIVSDNGDVQLTEAYHEHEDVAGTRFHIHRSKGSTLIDSDGDGIDEILFASGHGDDNSILHYRLDDMAEISKQTIARENFRQRSEEENNEFYISDLSKFESSTDDRLLIFATNDHGPYDQKVYVYDFDESEIVWNTKPTYSPPNDMKYYERAGVHYVIIATEYSLEIWKSENDSYSNIAEIEKTCEFLTIHEMDSETIIGCIDNVAYSHHSAGIHNIGAQITTYNLQLVEQSSVLIRDHVTSVSYVENKNVLVARRYFSSHDSGTAWLSILNIETGDEIWTSGDLGQGIGQGPITDIEVNVKDTKEKNLAFVSRSWSEDNVSIFYQPDQVEWRLAP